MRAALRSCTGSASKRRLSYAPGHARGSAVRLLRRRATRAVGHCRLVAKTNARREWGCASSSSSSSECFYFLPSQSKRAIDGLGGLGGLELIFPSRPRLLDYLPSD